MDVSWNLITVALLAYLLGNVMGGHVVGRMRGVDLSRQGSGNVGATNALRTQGKGFALLVLAIDVLKGVIAVLIVPKLLGSGAHFLATAPFVGGVAVTLGHCYPVLWKFQGGKGVATLAGVFGAVMPFSLFWILGTFILIVMFSGYVSLATLGATAAAGFYVAFVDSRGALSIAGAFTGLMAGLVIFKHRENILRLRAGTENRFDRLRIIGKALDQWREH